MKTEQRELSEVIDTICNSYLKQSDLGAKILSVHVEWAAVPTGIVDGDPTGFEVKPNVHIEFERS